MTWKFPDHRNERGICNTGHEDYGDRAMGLLRWLSTGQLARTHTSDKSENASVGNFFSSPPPFFFFKYILSLGFSIKPGVATATLKGKVEQKGEGNPYS